VGDDTFHWILQSPTNNDDSSAGKFPNWKHLHWDSVTGNPSADGGNSSPTRRTFESPNDETDGVDADCHSILENWNVGRDVVADLQY
jgi:hypothetical protein